ncbi:unnamed protein product [Gordionus sp. m RMFG-2023]
MIIHNVPGLHQGDWCRHPIIQVLPPVPQDNDILRSYRNDPVRVATNNYRDMNPELPEPQRQGLRPWRRPRVCYICRATDHVRNQCPRWNDERTTNRRPAPESPGRTERERSRSREVSIHTSLPVRVTRRTPENGVVENNGMTTPIALVEPWNVMNNHTNVDNDSNYSWLVIDLSAGEWDELLGA